MEGIAVVTSCHSWLSIPLEPVIVTFTLCDELLFSTCGAWFSPFPIIFANLLAS